VLSCGSDSTVRLWDVGSAQPVCTYEGATQQAQRSFCCFSHDEASVFSGDEATGDVRMWDTRSAELTGHRCKGAAGPAGAQLLGMAHSTVESALLTLGGDGVVRCWGP